MGLEQTGPIRILVSQSWWVERVPPAAESDHVPGQLLSEVRHDLGILSGCAAQCMISDSSAKSSSEAVTV